MTDGVKRSSAAFIALAWLLVGVPLGWGIYRSGLNAVKLFKPQPAVAAPANPGAIPPR